MTKNSLLTFNEIVRETTTLDGRSKAAVYLHIAIVYERHYGFLAPRSRAQKLARCRALLGDTAECLPIVTDRESLL